MRIAKLLIVLFRISPFALIRLLAAMFKNGINIMALLDFASRSYRERTVLVDDNETISYQQLFVESEQLSMILFKKYKLKKVALLCKNNAPLVRSIFAVSRLGADLYLLNTEMSKWKLKQLLDQHQFDLLIYDFELSAKVADYKKEKMLSDFNLPAEKMIEKLPRTSMGKIILLTGGTTGKSKEAAHKPSLFNYLNPFFGLVSRLKLLKYQTAFIATPIFHGYGVAVLFLFIALGKKVIISNGFVAKKACCLIREHNVEVVTVVPLMIDKMLKTNQDNLRSLTCIASGSAQLNPKLTAEVFSKLGGVLYNLYGTSETGLNTIATPQDLKYSATTIGRKINGVRLKVLDRNKKVLEIGSVGQFCVENNRGKHWIDTGDLGYCDHNGYYFLCGRTDDMIVSAGINVYPIDLEQILIHHPLVEEVAVIGVDDEKFGQRMKAFVSPVHDSILTNEELYEWLRPQVARFQVPKEIVIIDNMPYTPLGKLDKKRLKSHYHSI